MRKKRTEQNDGAVSFLHNVLREITSILLLPLIAQKVGYIEAACMAGAPEMDVCLPIINKGTKKAKR